MFLLRFNFSKVYWCFSLRKHSLSKEREYEEKAFLLALVFLDIVLRIGRTHRKGPKKRNKRKTKGRLQVSTKKYRNNNLYDA